MYLKTADLLTDVDQGVLEKVYCSSGHQDKANSGINFKIKFHPTHHDGSSCALYVTVTSHLQKKVIPPLDISVTVSESEDSWLSPSLSPARKKGERKGEREGEREGERCLAREKRTSRGNFVIQGQFTALFPGLVTHQRIREVSSEFVAVQVVMEYSTVYPSNPT